MEMFRICLPVGFLSVVEMQVSLQVVLEAEAQSTGMAGEGFLSRVNHSVLHQPHPAFKSLVALAALVWPLVRVRPLVDAQVAAGGEPFAAGLAGVRPRPCVDPLVLLQALLPGEALPTDVAHERFHLSV